MGLNGGALGNGTTARSSVPVTVTGLSNAVSVTAGYTHTCSVLSDGTAKCWGGNLFGGLGDGTTTDRLTPVVVSGVSGATAQARILASEKRYTTSGATGAITASVTSVDNVGQHVLLKKVP